MDYGTCQYLLVAILVIAVLPRWGVLGQDPCVKINSCSCKNSQGTIDLSPLDSGGGTNPKFKDVPSTDAGSNSFSWNPCTAFSEGDGSCTNVATCQVQPGSPVNYFPIGTQDTAEFQTDASNTLTLKYTATSDTLRTTYLSLNCDQSQDPGVLTAAGEDPSLPGVYELSYTGKYACPSTGPTPSPPNPGGLSVGSILVIVFFALIFVYVAFGIAFQIFVRKASGKEVVPQVGFWSNVPGLVKDGVFFIVRLPKRGQYSKT